MKNLFYAASSFRCHLYSINEFQMELQSDNAQFRLVIFCPMSPWNLTDDPEKQ